MLTMYKIIVVTQGGSPEDGEYNVKCKDAKDFIKGMIRNPEDGCYCYKDDHSELWVERVAM